MENSISLDGYTGENGSAMAILHYQKENGVSHTKIAATQEGQVLEFIQYPESESMPEILVGEYEPAININDADFFLPFVNALNNESSTDEVKTCCFDITLYVNNH